MLKRKSPEDLFSQTHAINLMQEMGNTRNYFCDWYKSRDCIPISSVSNCKNPILTGYVLRVTHSLIAG
jgi:hypothetical protein